MCVDITDNGMGIDPALQTSIFEMFEQVQRTSDRTTGGLGIGLALVRSIINLHGGTITCRSGGIGQGSCFTACIPRLAHAVAGPAKPSGMALPAVAPPSAQLSILVVDDNVDAAEMLEFFLMTAGHRLRTAHSARAALDAIRAAPPNVCNLDIGLPDSTGHALAVAIRQLAFPPPVLIALTGYSMARDRDQAAEAGFDFYFVKPANLGELSRALASVRPRAS